MLASWRVVHSYGVFVPKLPADLPHAAVRYEVSADGETWHGVGYPSRHSSPLDRPPLPLQNVLFRRVDFFSFYDGLALFFEPTTAMLPSPLLKSAFSHRHRIAWAMLTNASALRSRLLLPDSCPAVRYVRASLLSLVPASAPQHARYPALGVEGCTMVDTPLGELESQAWSRVVASCVHLPPTTLASLRNRFGVRPHREQLPRPSAYPPSSWGLALVSTSAEELRSRGPQQVVESRAYVTGRPLPCLMAYHLIPQRLHPTDCVDIGRKRAWTRHGTPDDARLSTLVQ